MEEKNNSFKLLLVQILTAPGAIMLGLYFYSTQVAQGYAFHPLLNDPDVLNIMLPVSIVIILIGAVLTIVISKTNNT